MRVGYCSEIGAIHFFRSNVFCSLLAKIKRSTGTQRNNRKVWSFVFFFVFVFSFTVPFVLRLTSIQSLAATPSLCHLNSWPHTFENDEQHVAMDNIFWRVLSIVRMHMNANIHSLSISFFLLLLFRFSRFSFRFRVFFQFFFRDILIGEISDEKHLNELKAMQRKKAKKRKEKSAKPNSAEEAEKKCWRWCEWEASATRYEVNAYLYVCHCERVYASSVCGVRAPPCDASRTDNTEEYRWNKRMEKNTEDWTKRRRRREKKNGKNINENTMYVETATGTSRKG